MGVAIQGQIHIVVCRCGFFKMEIGVKESSWRIKNLFGARPYLLNTVFFVGFSLID